MVFTKKVTKAPAVMVETKKMSTKDTCSMGCWAKMTHLLVPVLLIINIALLLFMLSNQTRVESDKVGWKDNYKMVQQIYKSATFKSQQKQQIEQALQQYQGVAKQPVQQVPTTTTAPAVVE